MKNNSIFFQNSECEFFPCHSMDHSEEMNCIFCFCPLYLKRECPGNPVWIQGKKGRKIKDCSQCLFPHKAENYEKIQKLILEMEGYYSQ